MANPSFDLLYGKRKKKKRVGEGQFTAELLKNRASLRDEAGKTLLLTFNISTSTTGHCWTQPDSELQGLDVYMCSESYFLQSSWSEKANIYTQVFLCLTLSPRPALQVLALTQLGTHRAPSLPRQGPRADLLHILGLLSALLDNKSKHNLHRGDKHPEVKSAICVCWYKPKQTEPSATTQTGALPCLLTSPSTGDWASSQLRGMRGSTSSSVDC